MKKKQLLDKGIFIIVVLLIWHFIASLNLWPNYLFPSPLQVGETVISRFQDGSFGQALLISFRRLLTGYFLSIVLGMALGILIALSKRFDDLLSPFILALQSVPSVVWLPLALLWFSMGEAAIIAVVVLGGTWNMVLAASSGIKNVDPLYKKAALTLGSSKSQLFRKVIFPASIPHLITGLRLSWAFSWRALMAGELLGSGTGLGQILMWGRDMGNMSLVLAVIFLIGTIGYFTDNYLFRKIENSILQKWGLHNKQNKGEIAL